jgi:hypothetical protein
VPDPSPPGHVDFAPMSDLAHTRAWDARVRPLGARSLDRLVTAAPGPERAG